MFNDLNPIRSGRRLGLARSRGQTRRTYDDDSAGFCGLGLTLHRRDIATIAKFLHEDG